MHRNLRDRSLQALHSVPEDRLQIEIENRGEYAPALLQLAEAVLRSVWERHFTHSGEGSIRLRLQPKIADPRIGPSGTQGLMDHASGVVSIAVETIRQGSAPEQRLEDFVATLAHEAMHFVQRARGETFEGYDYDYDSEIGLKAYEQDPREIEANREGASLSNAWFRLSHEPARVFLGQAPDPDARADYQARIPQEIQNLRIQAEKALADSRWDDAWDRTWAESRSEIQEWIRTQGQPEALGEASFRRCLDVAGAYRMVSAMQSREAQVHVAKCWGRKHAEAILQQPVPEEIGTTEKAHLDYLWELGLRRYTALRDIAPEDASAAFAHAYLAGYREAVFLHQYGQAHGAWAEEMKAHYQKVAEVGGEVAVQEDEATHQAVHHGMLWSEAHTPFHDPLLTEVMGERILLADAQMEVLARRWRNSIERSLVEDAEEFPLETPDELLQSYRFAHRLWQVKDFPPQDYMQTREDALFARHGVRLLEDLAEHWSQPQPLPKGLGPYAGAPRESKTQKRTR